MSYVCIITGCTLYEEQEDRWVGGDLFEVGECYVFNAMQRNGEAGWTYGGIPFYKRQIKPSPAGVHYFEKRGIFVFEKEYVELNQAAKEYLNV